MTQQSLKTQENRYERMKKIVLTGLYCNILIIILMGIASACNYNLYCEVGESYGNCPTDCAYNENPHPPINSQIQGTQHFEYSSFLSDNRTLRKFTAVMYVPSEYDTIRSGKSYQFYIEYHDNIGEWNTQNPNNTVSYCSLKIDVSRGISLLNKSLTANKNSTPYTVFNQNFTEDLQGAKYFVDLYQYDSAYIYLDCKFESPSERPASFIIPMDYSFVAPTQECVACQYYNWASEQVTVNKAKTLGEYTTNNLTLILDFFSKFYELLVVAFWILMILFVMLAVGLIFFSVYWVFKIMYKYVRV